MLRELENRYGVSGLETEVSAYLQEELTPYCRRIWMDTMGNLHAEKQGVSEGKTVLLTAYMDEPGIIITQITDDGYLKFDVVGRLEPSYLVSKRVNICGVEGIISLKAIHLVERKEREIPVKVQQLLVDIGAASREEAEKVVEIGEYGVVVSGFREFGEGFVKGRALAGRVSCAIAAEMLKQEVPCNLHVIFSVQREIGNRGMIPAGWGKKADLTIVLDGAEAGLWENKENKPEAGKGAVIFSKTGAGIPPQRGMGELLQIAYQQGLSVQICTVEEKGQEDALRRNGTGQHCLCLGIPVRYPRSTAQVAKKTDIEALFTLVQSVIQHIAKQEERK